MALDTLWSDSFPNQPRPQVYSSEEVGKDGYLPLTDTSDFLVNGLHGLGAAQLYALTANNADALRQAQEEWTNLERLATQIKTQDHFSGAFKDPQTLPSKDIFEERKEAMLYDYKYEANRPMLPSKFTLPTITTDQEKFDLREPPNPFAQRIPNDKQYRSIMTAAKNEGREKNPDNQSPYQHNFALQLRPKGTWIAKMAPNEALQPPRTRAREAQLNGATGDRQTRFGGEKVPPTRGLTAADDVASRDATPIGSPASRKRKIETVEVSLPRKKHPNQHTKRREREEAERLAALQGQPAELVTTKVDSAASSAPTPKKKHPNQYTKRREREEEEERRRRERAGLNGSDPNLSYGTPASSDNVQTVAPVKKKHPNQYTKRREQELQEQQERMERQHKEMLKRDRERFQQDMDTEWEVFQLLHVPGYAEQQFEAHKEKVRKEQELKEQQAKERELANNVETTSRSATPLSPNPQAQPQGHPNRNIDFSNMTTAELRTFTFKDWELTALLQERYLWLNDDPALAEQWKTKIENSAYAMRTYAMLKKWKEWASEGRDKRPRDKDKNKPKTISASANTNNNATTNTSGRIDGEEADVESMADDAPSNNNARDPSNDAASRPRSKIVTLKRLPRTRASRLPLDSADSPKVMPSSPLVNGINARDLVDLDPLNDQAKNRSFTSTLQNIGEYDNATKIGRWQAETVTGATSTNNEGQNEPVITDMDRVLLGMAKFLGEEYIPVSMRKTQPPQLNRTNSQQSATIAVNVQDPDRMEIDSEDPLALPSASQDSDNSESESSEAEEDDDDDEEDRSGSFRARAPPGGWTRNSTYNSRSRNSGRQTRKQDQEETQSQGRGSNTRARPQRQASRPSRNAGASSRVDNDKRKSVPAATSEQVNNDNNKTTTTPTRPRITRAASNLSNSVINSNKKTNSASSRGDSSVRGNNNHTGNIKVNTSIPTETNLDATYKNNINQTPTTSTSPRTSTNVLKGNIPPSPLPASLAVGKPMGTSMSTSTPTRRSGLRPNPVKRTLTNESLKMGGAADGNAAGNVGNEGKDTAVDGGAVGSNANGPVRRSLRNSGLV